MATSQDIELNNRLLALANTFAQGDQRIREGLKRMIGAQNDEIDQYEIFLDKSRQWNDKESKQKKETLLRLKKIELQEEATRQEYIDNLTRLRNTEQRLQQQRTSLQSRVARATTVQQQQQLRDHINSVNQQLADNQTATTRARNAYGAQFTVIKEAANQRKRIESQQLKLTSQWGSALRSNITNVLSTAVGKAFSPALLATALKDTLDAINIGSKTGGYGVGLNPFGDKASVFDAARLGMKPAEFIQMQAEMRRTILSTGRGMSEFVDGLNSAAKEYSDIILDPAERTKVAAQQLQMFTQSGIRFIKQDATAFAISMRKSAQVAGMMPEEFNTAIGDIIQSEETQTRLKAAASEMERRTILTGIQAQFAQNRAMGMTTEQAKAAAKALNKLAGQGPLERFRQAARLRAFGSAFGMGGESEQAARILIKGQRATADEQRQLQATLGNMSQVLSQSATGSMGAEIFATTLADKLQLGTLLGPTSPFNVTLSESVAPLASAAESMAKIPPELSRLVSMFNQLYSQATNNPLLTGAAGLLGMFGAGKVANFVGGKAASTFGRLVPGMGSSALGSAASATTAAQGATAASSTLRAVSMLSNTMKVLGPIASVGAGAIEGYEEYQQTGKTGRSVGKGLGTAAGGLAGGWGGAAAGAAGGALIGSMVPIVGTAAGAIIGGLLGAVGGGWGGGLLGGKAGAAAGSVFDEDEKQVQVEIKQASADTLDGIQKQVKQMDKSNDLLQTIADGQTKLIELNEKQLLTLGSDKDSSTSAMRGSRSSDNRFRSSYSYMG